MKTNVFVTNYVDFDLDDAWRFASKGGSIIPITKGKINITIIPSFNPYFYATEKRYYKKSISPIVEKIKDSTMAKILTLDGTIIGNESIISQVL